MRHLPLRELGYAVAFIAIPVALYVGVYYALVDRADRVMYQFLRQFTFEGAKFPLLRYRYGGEWAEAFFAPIHELDRKIRPEWWDEEAYANGTGLAPP